MNLATAGSQFMQPEAVVSPYCHSEQTPENSRLKRMYAELALENEAIKGLLKKL